MGLTRPSVSALPKTVLSAGAIVGFSSRNSPSGPRRRPPFQASSRGHRRLAIGRMLGCSSVRRRSFDPALPPPCSPSCCPYRTTSWNLTLQQREVLVKVSRPVLQQMMADCRPRFIAVAGRTAFTLLQEILSPEFVVLANVDRGGPGGTYQWAAHRARWRNDDMLLVQVPHFSRANSGPRPQECALWLADGLRRWSVAV
jgi:hypothetical protein